MRTLLRTILPTEKTTGYLTGHFFENDVSFLATVRFDLRALVYIYDCTFVLRDGRSISRTIRMEGDYEGFLSKLGIGSDLNANALSEITFNVNDQPRRARIIRHGSEPDNLMLVSEKGVLTWVKADNFFFLALLAFAGGVAVGEGCGNDVTLNVNITNNVDVVVPVVIYVEVNGIKVPVILPHVVEDDSR